MILLTYVAQIFIEIKVSPSKKYGCAINEKPRFYVKLNCQRSINAKGQAKAELLICSPGIKAPAMQAVRKQAAEPEMNALNAT